MEYWSYGMEEEESRGPSLLSNTPVLHCSSTPIRKECPA